MEDGDKEVLVKERPKREWWRFYQMAQNSPISLETEVQRPANQAIVREDYFKVCCFVCAAFV